MTWGGISVFLAPVRCIDVFNAQFLLHIFVQSI